MCGISCILHRGNSLLESQLCPNRELLRNRGPDGFSEIKIKCFSDWWCNFFGSTLWTQGPCIKSQPLQAPNKSLFLWNGDKFSDLATDVENVHDEVNDSEDVFSKILSHGISYLKFICGPYAFIYFDAVSKEVWFGRDILGRHSLLWCLSQNTIELSSVGFSCQDCQKFTEVPSGSIFKIDLSACDITLEVYPWSLKLNTDIINVGIPIEIKSELKHKVLSPAFGSDWLNKQPEVPDFILNSGNKSAQTRASVFQKALDSPLFSKIVESLKNLLYESVRKRVTRKPNFCRNCILSKRYCCHSKLGILFSGGLDSAILALIANSFVNIEESIDLYNVAFQRSAQHSFDYVPDRQTGRKTLEELKSLCPNRTWNFVEINIPAEELKTIRNEHISKLISPLSSILDDSLGCALWFAARGQGTLHGEFYCSPARIVLLGMGADELFGGYTKHRKVFTSDGWEGLGSELCDSIKNIGARNLGRDNRVVADHGRQPRTPYLDEHLVAYVDSLPPWHRCYLYSNIPAGIGDKFILRLLAWDLGLKEASNFPKKALQFGSQIANPKEKGHMTSDRLS